MLLSIIIPVYNGEDTVGQTLDSIIGQDLNDCEIVIVNDGSSDNSEVLIRDKMAGIENFKYIYQNNQGPSKARNTGILNAKGEYITFVDADDLLANNYLEHIRANLASNKDLYLYSRQNYIVTKKGLKATNLRTVNDKDSYSKENLTQYLFKILHESYLLNTPVCKVYRKKLLDEKEILFDEKYILGEDLIFNINYLPNVKTYAIINAILYMAIKRKESLTGKYHQDKWNLLLPVSLEVRAFLNNIDLGDDIYLKRLFRNVYSVTIDMFHRNSDMIKYGERKEQISELLNNEYVQEMLASFRPSPIREKVLLSFLRHKRVFLIYIASYFMALIKGRR